MKSSNIIFIWRQIYWQIFKSALAYLGQTKEKHKLKKSKLACWPKLQKNHITLVSYLLHFSAAKSPWYNAASLTTCIASCGTSSVAHHNPYINVFFVYLLTQKFFPFYQWQNMARLVKTNYSTVSRGTSVLCLAFKLFSSFRTRKGKYQQGRGNTLY